MQTFFCQTSEQTTAAPFFFKNPCMLQDTQMCCGRSAGDSEEDRHIVHEDDFSVVVED